MESPKAFIFDLNGTMIDDMEYHIKAWYDILNDELNAKLSRDEVKSHMYGKNSEVLIRIFGPDRFTTEKMDAISVEKERRYQLNFLPHLRLLPGLDEFLQHAHEQGIKIAIGSAAVMDNINFVIDNLGIRHYFQAIVSADDVTTSKPDPETFAKAADVLQVEPSSCIVFEDAPKGVEAALNAGMKALVLTTMHSKSYFKKYPNVLACVKDYTDPYCRHLLAKELAQTI